MTEWRYVDFDLSLCASTEITTKIRLNFAPFGIMRLPQIAEGGRDGEVRHYGTSPTAVPVICARAA